MMRTVLVELLPDDRWRHHRSEWYPFLQGYLRAGPGRCDWLSLEAGRESRPENYHIVDPGADDIERLLAALRPMSPTHLFFNEKLGPRLGGAIRAALPEARALVIGEDTPRFSEPTLDEIEAWVGEVPRARPGRPGRLVSDHAEPDYSSKTLNPGRLDTIYETQILGGIPCDFGRSIEQNPYFADLDLSDAIRTKGCSFCQGPFHGAEDLRRATPTTPAVELAVTQLRRFIETAPPDRRSFRFRIESPLLFRDLGRFFDAVLELPLSPAHLRFSRRVDEILARADALEQALPRLAERGHKVVFWGMGVENFSPAENLRMNKGLTLAQHEQAFARLRALEARWPEALVVFREAGFSTILFTPWTTLEDLEINLRALARLSEEPSEVFRLTTRMVLFPRTPLAVLAERDGLVAEAFDPAFLRRDCPMMFWDAHELPWRFEHPEVLTVFRFVIALSEAKTRAAEYSTTFDDPLVRLLDEAPDAERRRYVPFQVQVALLVEAVREVGAPWAEADVARSFSSRVLLECRE